ncbi:MAG: S8 family serine peptidase [Deltaproteobacteria bacterium]|nr:S8 family serine peptidase [Deltaproteobacteria bacterium]
MIGLVDWGLDFTHPNLRARDGRTRLLALWDQRPGRAHGPRPYGYGTVHGRGAIDRALAEEDPFAALGYDPADADVDGHGSHGTHVADIAAGRPVVGRGGVAPGASLVFVHLAMHERGPRSIASSVSLLEGIDFIARVAGARPWVINLSLGSHAGPHDGSTLVEQALDAAVSAGPGRVIVQSAGNYFSRRIHTQGVLRTGERAVLVWLVDREDETPNELEVWYRRGDAIIARVWSPSGREVAVAAPDSHGPIVDGGEVIGRFGHRTGDPNNGDNQITIVIEPRPHGRWRVELEAVRAAEGTYHAWIERDEARPGSQSRLAREAVRTTTTNSISNGHRTISVGAYDASRDAVAPFSSAGPTRDGRAKPDLVAPGVAIVAARSWSADGADLTVKSGTSMASPHVTGTVALMYEAAGRGLTVEEVRTALGRTARPIGERGGWGRLDTPAAVAWVAPRAAPALREDVAVPAPVVAIRRTIFSGGIRITPADPKQTWVGGQELAPQLARLVLTALVPQDALTDPLIAGVLPLIRNGRWTGLDLGRRATNNQPMRSVTVLPSLAFALSSLFEARGTPTLLGADELGRLERAIAVTLVWRRHGKALQESYPWMAEGTLAAYGWSERAYLDAIHMAIGTGIVAPVAATPAGAPGWRAWREQTVAALAADDASQLPWDPRWIPQAPLAEAMLRFLDGWNAAIEPLEAIRGDAALVKVRGYRYLWRVAEGAQATPRTPVDPEELRRFLTYAWQRRPSWAREARDDGEARRKLLEGFARYANVARKEGRAGAATGELSYTPGTANAPPLPASLTTSPPLSAPLFMMPAGGELRANMVLEFPDIYEAFGNFGYRWELVKLDEKTIEDALVRGHALGYAHREGAGAPGLGGTLANQLDRRIGYAKEDIARIWDGCGALLGTAGVGATALVGVGAIAGFIGEVISSVLEWLAAKHDEKRIALRDPGLYLLRCIATPVVDVDADRIRPPSAAYLPVWVAPIDEVADKLLREREQVLGKQAEELAARRGKLAATTDAVAMALLAMEVRRLEIELGGVDAVLGDAHAKLSEFLAKTVVPDAPLSVKRSVEASIRDASQQRDDLRARMLRRATWRSEIDPSPVPEEMVRLRGVMVTDDGASIELLADAWRHPGTGAYHVFDSTKSHGGRRSALDEDPSVAIRKGLKAILDDHAHGYGRGHVAFSVVIGGVVYQQSFRTAPDLPSALVHSLENAVNLATAVALVVVVASSGGTGLGLLMPLAIVGGVPSLFRLVDKARDGELGLDLPTLLDICTLVGTVAGAGQIATGFLRRIDLGHAMMIMGLGANGAGGLLLGVSVVAELAEAQKIEPPAARRAQIVRILAGAMQQLGMVGLAAAAGRHAHDVHVAAGGTGPLLERAPREVQTRLRELVGADVPVFVDPEAGAQAPRIRFDADGYKLPDQLRVVLPEAAPTPDAVVELAPAVRAIRRIDELAVGVRKLADRLDGLRARSVAMPADSRAGAAAQAIDGAPQRLTELATDVSSGKVKLDAADARLAGVRAELEGAAVALDELALGRRVIVQQEATAARAADAGYAKPPQGHYVVATPEGTFTLRRAVDSTVRAAHYDARKQVVTGDAVPAKPAAADPSPPAVAQVAPGGFDEAVTGTRAAAALGGPVRFERRRGERFDRKAGVGPRIRPRHDGGFEIILPLHKRARITEADVMRAIERRASLPARPAAPENGPTSRKLRGRGRLWSGSDEAQWRGYPCRDGHCWVWRGKDIDHIRRPGETGRSYRYIVERDAFAVRERDPQVFRPGDDPMEVLGANAPDEPFGLWVDTVTGSNRVLARILGKQPGEALLRPDGTSPITRAWIREQMGDPTGKTFGEVMKAAKRNVQPQLEAAIRDVGRLRQLKRYADLWAKAHALDPQMADVVVGHRALLDLTAAPQLGAFSDGLHPLDAGVMANDWFFSEVAPRFVPRDGIVREVGISADLVDSMGLEPSGPLPRLDGVLVPIATASEVKHGRSLLIHPDPNLGAHNKRQFEVFSQLPEKLLVHRRLPGGALQLSAMQYALTHPEGVIVNAGWLARRLLSLNNTVDFMLFDHERGFRIWRADVYRRHARAETMTEAELVAALLAFAGASSGTTP